jgi:hypothetical protein
MWEWGCQNSPLVFSFHGCALRVAVWGLNIVLQYNIIFMYYCYIFFLWDLKTYHADVWDLKTYHADLWDLKTCYADLWGLKTYYADCSSRALDDNDLCDTLCHNEKKNSLKHVQCLEEWWSVIFSCPISASPSYVHICISSTSTDHT